MRRWRPAPKTFVFGLAVAGLTLGVAVWATKAPGKGDISTSPLAIYNPAVPEFTAAHTAILEQLVSRGYAPVAFPVYANAIGVRRGSFAALLVPEGDAALKILGEPRYVIGSNLAVRARREGRAVFVWKDKVIEETGELLEEFKRFSAELSAVLRAARTNP